MKQQPKKIFSVGTPGNVDIKKQINNTFSHITRHPSREALDQSVNMFKHETIN